MVRFTKPSPGLVLQVAEARLKAWYNIIFVIVTNPKFIRPWVHEKFTVKFTISNVDGYTIYMHIGCLNCPEQALPTFSLLDVT